jgi:hypothetical protein
LRGHGSGIAAPGSTPPTPVANANAAALCPEGNERVTGILTCRVIGTAAVTGSGRRRRATSLRPTLTIVAVTPTAASPPVAARRPSGPPNTASAAAAASESFEWSAARVSRPIALSSAGLGVAAIAA